MKLYDAKGKQSCKICHLSFSHNKQGRFTSHLKNEHRISLNEYLLIYFYNFNDLKCSYDLCQNRVNLYRGIPQKYCSKSCAGKGKPLICTICGNKFDTDSRPNRNTKTCSIKCETKLRSLKTSQWHRRMDLPEKQEHFAKIISKTAITRRKNKTPSWNSGKTGIYSKETIEKIRKATLRQMEKHIFRKTNIELIMEEYLITKGIEYKYSFILESKQYDFLLLHYNIIIECDGDYWHANPKFYPIPAEWQLERIKNDREKDKIAISNGFKLIRFWEDDIINNFDYIKSIINELLATT